MVSRHPSIMFTKMRGFAARTSVESRARCWRAASVGRPVTTHFIKRHALLIALLILPFLPACTPEAFKRGVYDSQHQKYCVETAGKPDCDPEHRSYDRYRDALKRQNP